MSRQRLVAGNWKMNGDRSSNIALLTALREGDAASKCDVVVCPPYVFLESAVTALSGSGVGLGAQDICDQVKEGAFTGEVNGSMLSEIGCNHVIVGHSERRAMYGETDEVVVAKTQAAQQAGLTPIICVGETLEEREAGQMESVLSRQLDAVIDGLGVRALERAVLAYEPVWAIGTGKTASPEQAQEVHAFLRNRIAENGEDGAIIARLLRILYGGSVKADNAAELFACEDVDGGLVGGASLVAEQFLGICHA